MLEWATCLAVASKWSWSQTMRKGRTMTNVLSLHAGKRALCWVGVCTKWEVTRTWKTLCVQTGQPPNKRIIIITQGKQVKNSHRAIIKPGRIRSWWDEHVNGSKRGTAFSTVSGKNKGWQTYRTWARAFPVNTDERGGGWFGKQVNLTSGIQAPDWSPVVARGSGKTEVRGCQESLHRLGTFFTAH